MGWQCPTAKLKQSGFTGRRGRRKLFPAMPPYHLLFLRGILSALALGIACAAAAQPYPSRPIRIALFGLALGHGYLALDGLLLSMGRWYFRPFLFSEMATLLALWHAYETSAVPTS